MFFIIVTRTEIFQNTLEVFLIIILEIYKKNLSYKTINSEKPANLQNLTALNTFKDRIT